MDTSFFIDNSTFPSEQDLMDALGEGYTFWNDIRKYVYLKHPKAFDEWKYPGIKYGWNYRIKDHKRVIIYLSPREKYFKVAMVFGEKATHLIMISDISDEIKEKLASAIVYVEGRGIRIDVKNHQIIEDIKKLIDIKFS